MKRQHQVRHDSSEGCEMLVRRPGILPQGIWSLKRRSIFICLKYVPNPLPLILSGERDSLTWFSNPFGCQIAFEVRKFSGIIHLNRSGFDLNPFPLALSSVERKKHLSWGSISEHFI